VAGAAAVSVPIRFCPARMLVPSCGAVSVPPPRSSPGAAAAAVAVLVAGGAGAAGGGAGGSSVAAAAALGAAAGVGGSRWGATVSLRRTSLSCPRPPVPSSAAVGAKDRKTARPNLSLHSKQLWPSMRMLSTSARRTRISFSALVISGKARNGNPKDPVEAVAWPMLPDGSTVPKQEGPITAASPRRPPTGAAGDRRRPGPSTRAGEAVGVRVRRGGAVLEGRGVSRG
jgi:hypothetical protein